MLEFILFCVKFISISVLCSEVQLVDWTRYIICLCLVISVYYFASSITTIRYNESFKIIKACNNFNWTLIVELYGQVILISHTYLLQSISNAQKVKILSEKYFRDYTNWSERTHKYRHGYFHNLRQSTIIIFIACNLMFNPVKMLSIMLSVQLFSFKTNKMIKGWLVNITVLLFLFISEV